MEGIVAGMKSHPSRLNVSQQGALALGDLAWSNSGVQQRIGQGGGIQVQPPLSFRCLACTLSCAACVLRALLRSLALPRSVSLSSSSSFLLLCCCFGGFLLCFFGLGFGLSLRRRVPGPTEAAGVGCRVR